MNRHLSEEQVSRWILGEGTAQQEQHLQECSECRGELRRLAGSLTQFRGAVREWSGSQAGAEAPLFRDIQQRHGSRTHHWLPRRWHGWVLVAAVLCMTVTVPVYWNARVQQREAAEERADALLLEQVDSGISRAVPGSMEPLISLVSWNTETNGTKNEVEKP